MSKWGCGLGGGGPILLFTADGFKIKSRAKKRIALISLMLLIHVCLAQVGAEVVRCPGAEGPCRGHLAWP